MRKARRERVNAVLLENSSISGCAFATKPQFQLERRAVNIDTRTVPENWIIRAVSEFKHCEQEYLIFTPLITRKLNPFIRKLISERKEQNGFFTGWIFIAENLNKFSVVVV